jgi:hypothetical protein
MNYEQLDDQRQSRCAIRERSWHEDPFDQLIPVKGRAIASMGLFQHSSFTLNLNTRVLVCTLRGSYVSLSLTPVIT